MCARAREQDGTWVCLLLLCGAALAAAAAERESQLAQAPFILGSRFGRSSPRMLMPRNDKFFFSSRYGKRSPLSLEPPDGPLPPPRAAPAPAALTPALARPPAGEMLCFYTGVHSLYRCSRHDDADRKFEDSALEE